MQGIDLPGFPAEDGGFEEVMRLSLLKGAPLALSGVAWQKIRVRFAWFWKPG
jgi:hypothetical protein